jgi:hypothetical protein
MGTNISEEPVASILKIGSVYPEEADRVSHLNCTMWCMVYNKILIVVHVLYFCMYERYCRHEINLHSPLSGYSNKLGHQCYTESVILSKIVYV